MFVLLNTTSATTLSYGQEKIMSPYFLLAMVYKRTLLCVSRRQSMLCSSWYQKFRSLDTACACSKKWIWCSSKWHYRGRWISRLIDQILTKIDKKKFEKKKKPARNLNYSITTVIVMLTKSCTFSSLIKRRRNLN